MGVEEEATITAGQQPHVHIRKEVVVQILGMIGDPVAVNPAVLTMAAPVPLPAVPVRVLVAAEGRG